MAGITKREETKAFLKKEFLKAKSANDGEYIINLLRFIEEDFEDLRDELFVNTNLLPQALSTMNFWDEYLGYDIQGVIESEKWDTQKREIVWNELTVLAMQNVKLRAYSLASAMEVEFPANAIPLFEAILKIAPPERGDVERDLFEAYLKSGNWQKAEKVFLDGYKYWGNELSKIAIAAAKKGEINDSVRIWKLNANLDRRNLEGLSELAKTEAKPFLLEFYSNMKKSDPLSHLPDKALSILN